jgi:aminomethyltransferase
MDLKKTPLHSTHKSMGAKMVPFGGWDMPVQYSSILVEHETTRQKAGLFDVSHMGEIFLEGKETLLLSFLEKMTCNLVSAMKDGQVQYNAIMNENSGLVDDITLYKFHGEKYLICSNASNYEAVYKHLQKYNPGVEIRNESQKWHQIALQGPKSSEILQAVYGDSLDNLGYYRFLEISFRGEKIIISRTGYTGEDGFEIYTSNELGIELWKEFLDKGSSLGLVPVGLGARDTLRLEAQYPLYGHELTATRTPIESGIGWIVKPKTEPFLGYQKVIKQKQEGAAIGLTGIKLLEPGVPRENHPVYSREGKKIGEITSGTYSPTLKIGIALAILQTDEILDGQEVFVEIRQEKKKAQIHTSPFVLGSVRKK